MKSTLLTSLLLCFALLLNAQEKLSVQDSDDGLMQDPYLSMEPFNTIDASVGYSNVNSNNLDFGEYTLDKGKYYPSYSMGMYIHIPNITNTKNAIGKGKMIFNLKTGFLMDYTTTDLVDKQNQNLTFSQTSISIPLIIGYRVPTNHGNEKGSRYFKALSFNFGLFLGVPFSSRLHERGDITPELNEGKFGDYLRWGYITEIVFSAINKKGYGHRFGLRTIVDASSVIKLNEEKYGIYPTFISTGIFYTIGSNI